jgi:hypothetical protein
MTDTAYTLWEIGKDRFAVTVGRQVVPVVGQVSRSKDASWTIERAGKILSGPYDSAADAAKGAD